MYGKTEDKLHETLGNIQENWGKAVDSQEHQLKGMAKRYSANANYFAKDLIEHFKNNLKTKPLESILIAIGLGLMLGYLFKHKQ